MNAARPDDAGSTPNSCLAAIQRVLDDVLEGRKSQPIPEEGCAEQVLPLVRSANRLVRVMEELAQRLGRRIAAANAKDEHRYKLEVSLGVVFWPPDEKATLQELIERADQRMYAAKHAKRGAAAA